MAAMPGMAVFVFLGLVGLALFVAGLRGRRIDDHPVCRGCKFDLLGLPSERLLCPECGRDVSGPKTIRRGNRRKRRGLIWCGLLAVLVSTAALALHIGSGQFRLARHLPTPVLVFQTRAPATAMGTAAVEELLSRLNASGLSIEQMRAVAGRGLDLQADQRAAWNPVWGDFIEAAIAANALDAEGIRRYLSGGISVVFSAREKVVFGGRCGVWLEVSAARLGSAGRVAVQPECEEISIDGRSGAAEPIRFGGFLGVGPGGTASLQTAITLDAEPGRHKLGTRWTLKAFQGSSNTGPTLATWTVDREADIEVLPKGAEVVRVVADESLTSAIRASVDVSGLRIGGSTPGDPYIQGQARISSAPMNIAFDVFLRDPSGREWKVGTVARRADQGTHMTGFGADVPGLTARKVDVILRHSVFVALLQPEMDEIWGGEVVFSDVDVTWPETDPGAVGPASPK